MGKREYKCTATTKDALFQAIIRLAHEKEYDKITIRDICTAANISIGSFYHHFHSKEELAKETYYQIDRLVNENFMELCKQHRPEENLHSILKIYIEYVAQDIGKMIKVYYKVVIEETSISAFEPERLYYKTLTQILKDCAREGVIHQPEDFTELTEYCIRSIRGLIFDWCLHDCSYDLKEQFEKDYPRFLYGLR